MVQTTSSTRYFTRDRRVSAARLFAGGCALAAGVVLIGFLLEFYRFGASDTAAAARVEEDVRAQFGAMTKGIESSA